MKKVAIIGSREPSQHQITLAKAGARFVVDHGYYVASGGAEGIDTAATLEVGNQSISYLAYPKQDRSNIPPKSYVLIYDPKIHTEWTESVLLYHPYALSLKPWAKALHARNYGIVMDANDGFGPAELVIAFPQRKAGWGGTGQGIRIAQAKKIPLIIHDNLSTTNIEDFIEEIKIKLKIK